MWLRQSVVRWAIFIGHFIIKRMGVMGLSLAAKTLRHFSAGCTSAQTLMSGRKGLGAMVRFC
jgi:hypothetical protein